MVTHLEKVMHQAVAWDLQHRYFRVSKGRYSEGFVGCLQAAQNEMKGILAVSDVPLVSRDFALTDGPPPSTPRSPWLWCAAAQLP